MAACQQGQKLENSRRAGVVAVDTEARAALAACLALGDDDVVTGLGGAGEIAVVTDESVVVGGGGSDKGGRGEDGGDELELHCGGGWFGWFGAVGELLCCAWEKLLLMV